MDLQNNQSENTKKTHKPMTDKRKITRADLNVKHQPLTKKRFEQILTKAAQPVSEWQHGQEGKETSEFHLSDGCSDKCKSQDMTGDKEG